MQNSEFEKKIQQKMEELKFPPSDTVWQQIEAGLPAEKKRRRWIIFILLFITLSAGSLFFLNQFNSPDERIVENLPNTKKTGLQNTATQNSQNPDQAFLDTTVSLKKGEAVEVSGNYTINKKMQTTGASFKVKIKSGNTDNLNDIVEVDSFTRKLEKFKINADVKVKINASIPVSDIEENFIAGSGKEDGNEKIKIVTGDTAISTIVKLIAEPQKVAIDSVTLLKKDTTITVTGKSEKKKKISEWQYGIFLGSGISTVKNQLFSNSSVFANATGVFGGSVTNQSTLANDPTPGAAFNFGFYVQKVIKSGWKFNTGLTYVYQFNKLKVGNRVDSSANFYFDNKSIEANRYYKPGDSVTYKNKFHLLEIPLLFQYRLSKKSRVYFEAGPTVSYLIYSNAMIYNSSRSVYFTDNDLFSKFLLSFNAGAGINLAPKSKMPFSIGYQFKYGVGSIVKTTFGKQHLVTSVVYLKIPLKK